MSLWDQFCNSPAHGGFCDHCRSCFFLNFNFSRKFGVLGVNLFILLYLSYFTILIAANSNFDLTNGIGAHIKDVNHHEISYFQI